MNENRTALVTGASTGIGEACATLLAEHGWMVYAGVRKKTDGERLESVDPDHIRSIQLDVTKPDQIAAAASRLRKEQGRLDGLVNNAGIAVAAPVEFVPIDMFRTQLEINVTGQVAVTQAFLPLIREARGRVVFMSSTSGFLSTPFMAPYCASKFAIDAVADALRMEVKPWGIEVISVQPGAIETPIWDKSQGLADSLAASMPAEAMDLYGRGVDAMRAELARTVKNRLIPAGDVAKCVLHALSARRPRTRYRPGKDALPQYVLADFQPDRLRDLAILKAIGLPR
ncbi:MAG: SDR family oxidoreductase [Candidatus Hydrogenedentes bacterium]|nr:SDR family oxidoreductase [Candidatus Hydrogenedentota bacterium]